jgi:hypothetical protein
MFRCHLTVALIFATTLTATAQTVDSPNQIPPAATRPRSDTEWPAATRYASDGHKLAIVTAAKPGIRQSCSVEEITEDSIVCRAIHHKKITYQRDEIASIIDPPYHGSRFEPIFVTVVAASALAGLFLARYVFGVILGFPIGITLFVLARDENKRSQRNRNHDILIYQRPNTPLTVRLR